MAKLLFEHEDGRKEILWSDLPDDQKTNDNFRFIARKMVIEACTSLFEDRIDARYGCRKALCKDCADNDTIEHTCWRYGGWCDPYEDYSSRDCASFADTYNMFVLQYGENTIENYPLVLDGNNALDLPGLIQHILGSQDDSYEAERIEEIIREADENGSYDPKLWTLTNC